MTIAQWQVPPAVPAWARRSLWKLLDRAKLDPLFKPALEALRGELALPPLGPTAVFDRWVHAPQGGLALFPDGFASHQPDRPVPLQRGAFPLYDEPATAALKPSGGPSLQAFLDAGPAPVVFMPGSAQQGTAEFLQAALQASAQLGERGILLGPAAALPAPVQGNALWSAPYVPFGRLLPRARATVHHGGIGTCAQALRAGLPQLLWQLAYDQFDNALRLEQLSCGLRLHSQPLLASELTRQLSTLLARPGLPAACQRQAGALTGTDLAEACTWLGALP